MTRTSEFESQLVELMLSREREQKDPRDIGKVVLGAVNNVEVPVPPEEPQTETLTSE